MSSNRKSHAERKAERTAEKAAKKRETAVERKANRRIGFLGHAVIFFSVCFFVFVVFMRFLP